MEIHGRCPMLAHESALQAYLDITEWYLITRMHARPWLMACVWLSRSGTSACRTGDVAVIFDIGETASASSDGFREREDPSRQS